MLNNQLYSKVGKFGTGKILHHIKNDVNSEFHVDDTLHVINYEHPDSLQTWNNIIQSQKYNEAIFVFRLKLSIILDVNQKSYTKKPILALLNEESLKLKP